MSTFMTYIIEELNFKKFYLGYFRLGINGLRELCTNLKEFWHHSCLIITLQQEFLGILYWHYFLTFFRGDRNHSTLAFPKVLKS